MSDDREIGLRDLAATLRPHGVKLLLWPVLAATLAYAITWLVAPTFTARTSFLPPQQQQGSSGASAALASLGPLAALAGLASKTPADQYVSLMQSATVADRLIKQFDLMEVYDEKYRAKARRKLERNSSMTVGKKDGLIFIEVDDKDPQRAANIANQYVEELRNVTSKLALTEAQQRRVFFEAQLEKSRDGLAKAQVALQETGFNAGAIKSEPRAAAEGYARLRAELTAAEVRLRATRQTLVDNAPEVQQQLAVVGALRAQLARLEQTVEANGGPDYVTKYRDYKYQEALFDIFARQYELARVDESRDSPLIQVVDMATPPEVKSKPRRAVIAISVGVAAMLLLAMALLIRAPLRRAD
jgi:uncharacterized protein involved in exopolysaccharide biosynthesis